MNNTLSRFAYIDAARATAQSFVDLVRGIDNPDVSLSRRSTWTVADCVGHVASEPARYLDLVRGATAWPNQACDLKDIYAKQIANLPTRDVHKLAEKLADDLDELLNLVCHFGARVPVMAVEGDGRGVRADSALGILIGKMTVHGHDIARAIGARWELDPEVAPLVARGRHQLLPCWNDNLTGSSPDATVEIRFRGTDERFVYQFTDGHLEINPGEHADPDLYVSVKPAAGVLIGYGRMSPVRALLTGRAMAWGTSPWLATHLVKRFAPLDA
ncbi:maleylpyruvate isomerase N-terminal domain-containing protein [Gordonia aichiensis]|uniref:Mycothiol-dependent maleylpyruvate isomerase metal-binding domain-containing protein n=1 Tax=Gordonia aichiensis NBRC 108223 TaxID=1220583 RepID=L7KTA7_9ACTN|nr:maleylpyruvate isomerase N-terminal domain-containing protein [Gordonia aichiensis]GAC50938.1 hypothetical protein GOACH_34_00210 [Gordonia aichiensis NBRC 108223]